MFHSLPMLGTAMELAGGVVGLTERLRPKPPAPEHPTRQQVQAMLSSTQHCHFLAALMLPQLDDFMTAVQGTLRRLQAVDSRMKEVGTLVARAAITTWPARVGATESVPLSRTHCSSSLSNIAKVMAALHFLIAWSI